MANPAPPTSWVGESGTKLGGEALLEGEQLVEQLVELRVGHDRRVLDVVAELMLTHLFGKILPTPPHIRIDGINLGIGRL